MGIYLVCPGNNNLDYISKFTARLQDYVPQTTGRKLEGEIIIISPFALEILSRFPVTSFHED